MSNDKLIREIESIIDVYHKQSDFFNSYSNNRNQALYDILRTYERLSSTLLVGGVREEMVGLQNADIMLLSSVHNLQDALNTAIKWIYQDCTPSKPGITHQLSDNQYSEAVDLLVKYADSYAVIADGYISYSRKQNTGRVEGHTVIFDATKEQMTSFLCDIGEKINDKHNTLSEMIIANCLSPEFQSELDMFAKTIRQEEGRLCYDISEKLSDYACDIGCKQWDVTSNVPQGWKFDHFSLLEFKNCWTTLYAVCLIHFFAELKSGLSGMAQENAVITLSKATVIEYIHEKSGIEEETVEAIIDFLTYDPQLRNTDVMYQPIIAIEDLLIITPTLILSSSPERNMIAVIQKKDDFQYSVEVNNLENIMADEIISYLPEGTIYCTSKHLSKELPDVDLAIYDSLSNAVLIAEMKWLIAADSTKEVLERRKDIDHGCSQVEDIIGFAMKNSITFANRILPISISEKPDLFWCVVAKHDIRSTNSLVPVISQNSFNELLKGYSLSTVFHKIRNRDFYKPLPAGSYMDHKKVKYANYEFWIPALVIEAEYEAFE